MTSHIRAATRKRKIIKTFSMGLYSKVVGVLVTLIMVPLAVNYLGTENYGLWVAVSSLITMFSFVDGGIGNAVLNAVSHATGVQTSKSIKTIASSGFYMLLLIALLGMILFSVLYPFIPWAWVFGLPDNANRNELCSLVLIVGIAFFLNMPFTAVGNVQRGFQEGNIESFWNAKGRILSIVFVLVAIQTDSGLLGFAIAFVSGPIIASLCNNIYYFLIRKKALIPNLNCVKRDDVKIMLGTGGLFFVLQFTSSIQMQADNIIIANMLGPTAVPQYAICMQLFLFVPMILSLLWAPLWPAYREALASGDVEWIKRIFIKSINLALIIGIPASLIFIAFGQDIIRLWVGKEVAPSMLLLIGCGIWMLMIVVGNAIAVLLNGLQIIKIQIMVAVSAAVLNVGLTICLIILIGVEGAVYGSVLSFLVSAIIPYYFIVPKLFRDKVKEKA